jgi:hypothetical protein
MATSTIAVESAVLQFPKQIPADCISQQELTGLLSARTTLAKLREHVDTLEASLLDRLRAGAVIDDGELSAEVKRSTRRSPAWKEIVRRLAGRLGLDGDAYTNPSESFSLEIN